MDRDAWDERYREKDLLWTAEPNRFLVEAVGDLPPGTAYDLAGGEGRNAVWLAEGGWSVTVVDWSAVALQKGRDLAAHRGVAIRFDEADLLTWLPGERANLVAVVYLQIPPRERHAVWHTAIEALAPGGRLVIVGHDIANLTDGFGGPQSAEVLYTADEVVEVIGDRVTVTRAEMVERPVTTDDGEIRIALDNIVVAAASGVSGP